MSFPHSGFLMTRWYPKQPSFGFTDRVRDDEHVRKWRRIHPAKYGGQLLHLIDTNGSPILQSLQTSWGRTLVGVESGLFLVIRLRNAKMIWGPGTMQEEALMFVWRCPAIKSAIICGSNPLFRTCCKSHLYNITYLPN